MHTLDVSTSEQGHLDTKQLPPPAQGRAVALRPGNLPQKGIDIAALCVFGFFFSCLALWCYLDHTSPTWDGAGHALRGYQCADILRSHACLSHKLLKLMTVTSFYPTFAYIVQGVLHVVLGNGQWVDGLARFIWYGLAGFALYKTTALLLNDRAAAAVAAAVFYLYPGTYGVSHAILLLDMPLTAMVFICLWRLAAWHQKPTWTASIILGVALGCSFLTKHTAPLFFAAPLTILFIDACRLRNWTRAAQLVSVGLLSVLLFLCWLIPNWDAFRHFISSNQSVLANHSLIGLWTENFWQYFVLASTAMSPLGLLVFVASLFYLRGQRQLWLLGATGCGALVLHVVLNWIPQFRYLLPATAYSAALSAAALVYLWRTGNVFFRSTLVIAALYGVLVFLSINFTPWPIATTKAYENVTGVSWIRKNYPAGIKSEPQCPTAPSADWGYDWVFSTIGNFDGKATSTLCVFPDLAELNTPGFMYFAAVRHSPVQLTTYRLWSMAGYDFVYTDENLRWVRWYVVLKNSSQKEGREFATPAAGERFRKLVHLLESDRRFVLVGTKTIPGGGELMLYRNVVTDATTRPPSN